MIHAPIAPLLLALALSPQDANVAPDPRADYDVQAYAIALEVDPEQRRIAGSVTMTARVTAPELATVVLDVGPELEVAGVQMGGEDLAFERVEAQLRIPLPAALAGGSDFEVRVAYAGRPTAKNSFTGFHWERTADGRPWIGTSCQGPGAHTWWPCKASFFHPADKPERVSMDVTVPAGLYAVSNGRLEGIDELADGRRTFRWRHPYPLETYTVTLNVAPYVVVESELALPGLDRPVPYAYYVLPENAEKAALQFAQVPQLLSIFSEAFGPWPFPDAKFGLVETSFWGMEHSTAVAYGSSYPAWCRVNGVEDRYAGRNRDFDYILVHEVAHEWWGNAVSAVDWGDFWIHEGFGTYAEGVYVERTAGRAAADRYFASQGRRMGKRSRLYRGAGTTSAEAYSGVIYSKGAAVLNTLRHYVDDDAAWWRTLREFNLDARYGNATTEDFRSHLERVTGRGWGTFFEEYVYGEGYPRLTGTFAAEDGGVRLALACEGSGETGFHVPLDLVWREGGDTVRRRVMVPPGEYARLLPTSAPPTDVRVENLGRVLGRHAVEPAR
jgi:aminopeptidase N